MPVFDSVCALPKKKKSTLMQIDSFIPQDSDCNLCPQKCDRLYKIIPNIYSR